MRSFKDLENFREEIDSIDEKIVGLFQKRMEIVAKIVEYKIENNLPVLNSTREEEIIKKNREYLTDKDLDQYLEKLYIEIMTLSKDYQGEKIEDYKKEWEKKD